MAWQLVAITLLCYFMQHVSFFFAECCSTFVAIVKEIGALYFIMCAKHNIVAYSCFIVLPCKHGTFCLYNVGQGSGSSFSCTYPCIIVQMADLCSNVLVQHVIVIYLVTNSFH